MRLIDTETLELHEFWGDKIPEYAILSHTWEEGEVTFQDWNHLSIDNRKKKKGYYKIDMACRKAQEQRLKYLWVDTNCIDKSSSAELSEAINSMFSWYQKASICYVYLADVESMPADWKRMPARWRRMADAWESDSYFKKFCQSKWFTRGWTLQELLAPTAMTFYSQDWSKIASRATAASFISKTTQISIQYLHGDGVYKDASIAQKMSWVSRRTTTRIEDMAYCMLGIFDINMPLLYGEGPKSFIRLQEEIIRTSNDQTIFCWTWIRSVPVEWVSLLAPCPEAFQYSGNFVSADHDIQDIKMTYKMTNAGLSINLPMVQAWSYYLGILSVKQKGRYSPAGGGANLVCVPIQGYLDKDATLWRQGMQRIGFPPGPVSISTSWALCQSHVYIRSKRGPLDNLPLRSSFELFLSKPYCFLLVFGGIERLLHDKFDPNTMKSKIAPGTQVCLLERIRHHIKLNVFVPFGHFDEKMGLIAVSRTSLPNGFLIRIAIDTLPGPVLFIGIDVRSHQLYRFCSIVPETILSEISNDDELLQRLLSLTKEKSEECDVSCGNGLRITMREEAVNGFDLICLTYITCQAAHDAELESGDDSDIGSDVAVEGGRHHEEA